MTISADLITSLVAATEEVFETMIFKPLVRVPPTDGQGGPRQSGVVASVAFAGHRRGLVSIHSSLDAARNITGAMLGMPCQTVNGEMADAMGEVANMVAGTFRNKLAAVEPASNIAVPMVTIGSDFVTKYSHAVRRAECAFEMEGHCVSVDLILIGNEPARTRPA